MENEEILVRKTDIWEDDSMRIAVFAPTPPWIVRSGLETVAFESAKNLRMRGHQVDMVCLSSKGKRTEVRDGVRVFYSGKKINTGIPALDHLLNSLMHLLTSHAGIREKYDVLYVHKGIAIPQLLWKTPSVKYSYGEFLHWSPVTLTNTAIDMFDIYTSKKVIACSEFAESQIKGFPGMKQRVAMITPGTYTRYFRPMGGDKKLKKKLGIRNENVIIFAGRVTESKGCGDLIEIAAAVARENPDTKFLFVGKYDTSYASNLLKKAETHGIKNNVVFAGDADYYEMPKYYGLSDIQVLPSHMEAFGMVNIEAQSCGLPSIAYDTGGVSSSIKNGVTGYLVKMGDKKAFAQKINFLLNNEKARARMGKAGRERAKKEFDWSIIAEKTEKVLMEAAAE
ncbi:MAG: glycosyltransferase family 4 protein [Candidatus Aenigmarchaeota archaeon]|nr:glycosyltransferase family 4 protein [Candidatus Aenigmarchaeota archaeon]